MSREDLEELLKEHLETVPLFVQVLYAAGVSGHDSTLSAMGASLGLGATAAKRGDGEALADIEGALRVMRDLDDRHFAILHDPIALPINESSVGVPDLEPFATECIAERTGLPGHSVATCSLQLALAGLILEAPVATTDGGDADGNASLYFHNQDHGAAYVATDLGRAIAAAAALSH